MIVKAIKTRLFTEGENLLLFIEKYIKHLLEDSVLVITSKIVALAENRTVIANTPKEKEKIIKAESEFAISTKHTWLTVKDGMLMASAGIDASNANGKLILLPSDSYKIARVLHSELKKKFKLKRFGVLITDSRTTPLRAGVTGVALAYAGFCGIKDYRGKPDIFGRKFKFSRVNIADSLATAAVLMMGEGAELCPLALIEKAPICFCEKVNRRELRINLENDMYRPFFIRMSKKIRKK